MVTRAIGDGRGQAGGGSDPKYSLWCDRRRPARDDARPSGRAAAMGRRV